LILEHIESYQGELFHRPGYQFQRRLPTGGGILRKMMQIENIARLKSSPQ